MATESATDYTIRYGISITIGMEWPTTLPLPSGIRVRPALVANYRGYRDMKITFDAFLEGHRDGLKELC